MRERDAGGRVAQRGLDAVLRLRVEAAHRAGDGGLGRQHVVAAAAVHARDGQHRRFGRVDAARDDGVELRHELARREQHVGRAVRLRGMAAAAAQHDVEAVGRGHDRTRPRLRVAQRQVGPVVQRVDGVAREALEQALLDHHARAAAALFGGLEDEVHRAIEAPRARELAALRRAASRCGRHGRSRGARRHGGWHARSATARRSAARPCRRAGRRRGRLLPWRKRADTPVPAIPSVTSSPSRRKSGRHDARGAPLLEGQFGVRVQVAPQGDQWGQEVVDQLVVLQRHGRTVVGIDAAA